MALPGGSTAGLIIGLGVGGATAAALEPVVETERQKAWQGNTIALPDVAVLAELVAGGKLDQKDAYTMANRLGFDDGTLDSLTWLAQNRLDFPLMLRMWRLAAVNPDFDEKTLAAKLDETLAHLGLDWSYEPFLKALKTAELPGIGDIAYGVVRGILPAPKWVPVAPPPKGDYVPRFPQVQIDPVQLAAAEGFDENMLKLLVGRSGLSMAPIMAAQSLFRSDAAKAINNLPAVAGISGYNGQPYVGPNDYLLAIAEGDLRTEWADAVRETAREILTAGEYAELELRGFLDAPTRRALTSQHGMSDFDSDLLYDVLGRAPAVHAITTGLARGGIYKGDASKIEESYLSSMQRGNIRPEYYNLEYANRYSYPSGFQIRAETQDGNLSQADSQQILLEIGWSPKWAGFFSKAWAGSGGAPSADKHVAKAQTQVWTATHKAYVNGQIAEATATAALEAAGVPAGSVGGVLDAWDVEHDLTRKSLSAAQIKKAWFEQIPDPATGQPISEDEAVAMLGELGYAADAARLLLAE